MEVRQKSFTSRLILSQKKFLLRTWRVPACPKWDSLWTLSRILDCISLGTTSLLSKQSASPDNFRYPVTFLDLPLCTTPWDFVWLIALWIMGLHRCCSEICSRISLGSPRTYILYSNDSYVLTLGSYVLQGGISGKIIGGGILTTWTYSTRYDSSSSSRIHRA